MLELTLLKALGLSRSMDSHGDLELRRWLITILPDPTIDDFGNIHQSVGESKTLFVAHTDTVHSPNDPIINQYIDEGDILRSTPGNVLGADDGAGIALLVHMIYHGVPGHYCFTIGEERGGYGAKWLSDNFIDVGMFDRAIAFDRRDRTHVITHQMYGRCCSDAFADALSVQLGYGYQKNNTGVYTDTAEFVDMIRECTNISAGYFSEHSDEEHLDMVHFLKLSESVLKVDWENLPVVRDPFELEDDSSR